MFNFIIWRYIFKKKNKQNPTKERDQKNKTNIWPLNVNQFDILVVRSTVMAEWLSAWLRHGDVHGYVESHLYGSDVHSSGRVSKNKIKTKPPIQYHHLILHHYIVPFADTKPSFYPQFHSSTHWFPPPHHSSNPAETIGLYNQSSLLIQRWSTIF